jgi:hypothetical protein
MKFGKRFGTRFGNMIAAVALLAACAVSTSVLAYGQQSSPPSNQIMFEGVGSGTFNSHQTNFDFSVRCYGSSCVGAFVFPKPGKSVVNYVSGTVTQLQPGMYMMSLSTPSPTSAPPSQTVSCSLVNAPPVTQGETNTVTMSCSTPAGSGSSQNAVVLAPQL